MPAGSWTSDIRRYRRACRYVLLALLSVLTGCSPATDRHLALSPRILTIPAEQATELPAAHTGPLERALLEYFGPWTQPTFRLPVLVEDETGEGEASVTLQAKIAPAKLARGQQVYLMNCALCHGVTGDGQGVAAAYLEPKPRDYRAGVFKFTSTPYGSKPRRSDLMRTIRAGAKGTSMPAFRFLAQEDLEAVIDYVIMLSHRGEIESAVISELVNYGPDEQLDSVVIEDLAMDVAATWDSAAAQVVMPISPRPAFDEASIRLGMAAFLQQGAAGCAKCHGADGRGHTQDNVGRDTWGNAVKAADLTAGMLHGGRRPIDIYRRIYSGINGTPMPAFASALSEEPDTIWHLVHFVLAVVDGRVQLADHSPTNGTDESAETAGGNESEVEAASESAEPQADEASPIEDTTEGTANGSE